MEKILEGMPVLEPSTPMMAFVKDISEKAGFNAYEICCGVEELPRFLRNLVNSGARVMVASIGSSEKRWTTEWMGKQGYVQGFQESSNLEEKGKSSCVPVALRNLGFEITKQLVDEVSGNYDKSVKPKQKYHGHVMAVHLEGGKFKLTDQYGSGDINDDVLIEMAKFRVKSDNTANQGYFFIKEIV